MAKSKAVKKELTPEMRTQLRQAIDCDSVNPHHDALIVEKLRKLDIDNELKIEFLVAEYRDLEREIYH